MRGVVDGLVVKVETCGVPALFDLWVNVASAVKVGVDTRKDGGIHFRFVILDSIVEHNL